MSETTTLKACVLGSTEERTLTPSLHRYWLEKYGIKGKYSAKEVSPADLARVFSELEEQGYIGCNIAGSLKEKARSLMDEVCGSCEVTNATDTVVFKNGRRIGYSSDWFGFIKGLDEQVPDWEVGRTVIMGAGNAARSVIYALMVEGVKDFVFTNRTPNKIEKIREGLGISGGNIVPWEKRNAALEGASLVVNCTCLGQRDFPSLDINLDLLPETATVCDLVYDPAITPLLKTAIKRGNKVAEGLPMLLHQGKLGFRKWFGVEPEVDSTLYTKIKAEL